MDFMKDDPLIRPTIPLQRESDSNSRFEVVEQIKEDNKNNSNTTESGISQDQKGLNLDIDLINESFLAGPSTKSPNLKFPSQPNSKGSFKRIGDWTASPNASSFQLRKKIDNS